MAKKDTLLALACFACSLHLAFAQPQSEKLFNSGAYGRYIEFFQNKDRAPEGDELMQLAESYRKLGNTESSEELYRRLVEKRPDEPKLRLYYAQALQGNAKYAQAKVEYLRYDALMREQGKEDKRGAIMAAACDRIQNLKATGKVKVVNERKANDSRLDFSPMYYGDGIVFVSSRGKRSKGGTDRWINDNFMELFYAEKGDDGRLGKPRIFATELNTKYHEGPVSFSADQKRIYFTRNNYNYGKRGKSSDGVTKLEIYSARKVGRWIEVKPFEHGDEEYDICHPALAPDGQSLIFASDKPGGYGGLDLYICKWQGSSWAEPENMGPEVNSPGNEVFPFLHANGTLYFASDGWGGLGRMDIFLSQPIDPNADSLQWSPAFNLGAPFNTQYDDFGFIIDLNEQSGYFSSNRQGGKGLDDIYSFEIEGKLPQVAPAPLLQSTLCAYDAASGMRIEGASLRIRELTEEGDAAVQNLGQAQDGSFVLKLKPTNSGDYSIHIEPSSGAKAQTIGQEQEQFFTNEQGIISYALRLGKSYLVEAEKAGYRNKSETVKFLSPDQSAEWCVALERSASAAGTKDKPSEPEPERLAKLEKNYAPDPFVMGRVYNKEYDRPLPGSELILFNRCTGEEIQLQIAKDGSFDVPLECGCDYIVRTSKDNFHSEQQVISLVDEDSCKGLELKIALVPEVDKYGRPTAKPRAKRPGAEPDGDILATKDYSNLQEGDVISLRNIFYDYNAHAIREDARPDLENLLALLEASPTMQIELSSHTDSRGTEAFNQALSQRRADAAKSYLVERGIDASRIRAKGYGENRPKNDCVEGKPCSEFEHQRNRRTEVFVTKFPAKNYEIEYSDNKPSVVNPKP